MPQERNTRQRRAIAKALEDVGRPVTPEELLDLASREVPRLGIATVYRAIRAMKDDGEVVAVELAGHPTCYEPAHHGHHHHFHCRRCQTVFEVHACAADIAAMAPKGFRLEDHEIVLRGLCAGCAAN